MKLIKYRPGDRILLVLADIIVRIGFFIGGVFSIFALGYERPRHHYPGPYVLEIAFVAGVLSAIFGPSMYRRSVMRGRGTLEEVKRQSGDEGN